MQTNYWTIGTRDFRNLIDEQFETAQSAVVYRESNSLCDWILINVHVARNGNRVYMSPESPEGPLLTPVAGSFR